MASSLTETAGKGGAKAPSATAGLAEWWREAAPKLGWTVVSVGMFALIWEFLWLIGVADPKVCRRPTSSWATSWARRSISTPRNAGRSGRTPPPVRLQAWPSSSRSSRPPCACSGPGARRHLQHLRRRRHSLLAAHGKPDAADHHAARPGLADRLVAGRDLPLRHRQRARDLHGVHCAFLHHDARHDHADRQRQQELHQRRPHDGRLKAADLQTRHPARSCRAFSSCSGSTCSAPGWWC